MQISPVFLWVLFGSFMSVLTSCKQRKFHDSQTRESNTSEYAQAIKQLQPDPKLDFEEDIDINPLIFSKTEKISPTDRPEISDTELKSISQRFPTMPELIPAPTLEQQKRCKLQSTENETAVENIWRQLQRVDRVFNTLRYRSVWTSLFNNKISKMLVSRYMDCKGTPIVLSKNEMIYLFVNLSSLKGGFPGSKEFLPTLLQSIEAQMKEEPNRKEFEVQFKFLDFSSGGNLGNFWNHNKGTVTLLQYTEQEKSNLSGNAKLFFSYRGTQSWSDIQDYNTAGASRERGDQWRVAFADRYMRGLPFEIRTEEIKVAYDSRIVQGDSGTRYGIGKGWVEGGLHGTLRATEVGGYTDYGMRACRAIEQGSIGVGDAVAGAGVAGVLEPVAEHDAVPAIASATQAMGPEGTAVADAVATIVCIVEKR